MRPGCWRAQSLGELWTAPVGSNDDWYWLYGAAVRGARGVLISNDLMRDHNFALLRPRFFAKWRRHHQWHYDVWLDQTNTLQGTLEPPPRFSTCVQQLAESASWLLPQIDGSWLCAQPIVSTAPTAAARGARDASVDAAGADGDKASSGATSPGRHWGVRAADREESRRRPTASGCSR